MWRIPLTALAEPGSALVAPVVNSSGREDRGIKATANYTTASVSLMSEALFCSGFVMFNAENGILIFDCNLRPRELCIGLTTSGRVSIKMCDVGANLGDNLMPGELFTGYEPSLQDSRCVYEAISALS